MNTEFTLAPLFRHSVGFDRFNDLFESALQENNEFSSSYPAYNVEKHGDDQYRIVLSLAGFEESNLEVKITRGLLIVNSKKQPTTEQEDQLTNNIVYLHKGIIPFNVSFRLDEHIEVKCASLNNGLLTVDLIRRIPEEAKPKWIPINKK